MILHFRRRTSKRIKNGELRVIAISIIALGAAGILSSSVHAEEDCLAAPSGRPPPDSQWHYRTDHLKQRKCWHLRVQGEEAKRVLPPQHGQKRNVQRTHPLI